MAEKIQGCEASPGVSNSSEEDFENHYDILAEIGKGTFGRIYQATHILTGMEVAVKVIKKLEHRLSHITSEVDVIKTLEHPNTVQLFEVLETPNKVFLVMEFLGGGQLPCGLREEEARPLFRQILWAVAYCHRKGIVHRDLKPDNILLDREGKVKVIDFGLSRKLPEGQKLTSFCGTIHFCAPELYQKLPYGTEADIWALGILLHYMLTNTLPFKGKNQEQLQDQVVLGHYRMPAHLSTEAQSLMKQLLTVDQAQRPRAEEILGHPWMVQGESVPPPPEPLHPKQPDAAALLVMQCLGYDPRLAWISVSHRLFDHLMATYQMVQLGMRQGADRVRQKHHRGATPPPTPAFPLPPGWRASEPAPPTSPLLSQHSLGQEDMEPGQKGRTTHSLPAILLARVGGSSHSPPDTLLPSPEESATSLRSNILPRESPPSTVHQLSPKEREEQRERRCGSAPLLPATVAEGAETPQKASVPIPEQREPTPTPSRASQHDLAASAPEDTRGWRPAGRRILGRILSACCCCLMAQKIRPGSTQEAKARGKQKCPRKFQAKVSPEKQAAEMSPVEQAGHRAQEGQNTQPARCAPGPGVGEQ